MSDAPSTSLKLVTYSSSLTMEEVIEEVVDGSTTAGGRVRSSAPSRITTNLGTISTPSKSVLAAFLRGVADELDPPKKTLRSFGESMRGDVLLCGDNDA